VSNFPRGFIGVQGDALNRALIKNVLVQDRISLNSCIGSYEKGRLVLFGMLATALFIETAASGNGLLQAAAERAVGVTHEVLN
jgi:hypothetical protein